jgi:hypothetical protein
VDRAGLPGAQDRRRLPARAALDLRRSDPKETQAALAAWSKRRQHRYPKLADWAEDAIGETLTIYKSMGLLERLNEESHCMAGSSTVAAYNSQPSGRALLLHW